MVITNTSIFNRVANFGKIDFLKDKIDFSIPTNFIHFIPVGSSFAKTKFRSNIV